MKPQTTLNDYLPPDAEWTRTALIGKHAPPVGRTPAIALVNPKFPHNVGAAVRAASCFGAEQVWFTGKRVILDPEKGERLPREERMKGYKDVELVAHDYFFDAFPKDVVPVAVEVRPNSESLHNFVHPTKALYLITPSRHCLNLAAAVNVVLYDRCKKIGWLP